VRNLRDARSIPAAVLVLFRAVSILFPLCVVFPVQAADAKAPEKNQPPVLLVATPLGLLPGQTNAVVVRGLRLDSVVELRTASSNSPLALKIKSKGKAELPKQQEATEAGDTRLDFELFLPAAMPQGSVSIVAISANSASKPFPLLVVSTNQFAREKEPNGGFQSAQKISVPQTIQGAIDPAEDVDVFSFHGSAGERLEISVTASAFGSVLDPLLTIYDAAGDQIRTNDDTGASRDSTIRLTLPDDGQYFIALVDANDRGGPAHVYLLNLRRQTL